jgi:hypothetical protein
MKRWRWATFMTDTGVTYRYDDTRVTVGAG